MNKKTAIAVSLAVAVQAGVVGLVAAVYGLGHTVQQNSPRELIGLLGALFIGALFGLIIGKLMGNAPSPIEAMTQIARVLRSNQKPTDGKSAAPA